MSKIILLDNYDSFTYNLAQYIWGLGYDLDIYRNDQITISEIEELQPSHLIISPGPGIPSEAGISLDMIDYFHTKLPILGICLGHQALGQYFGASIVRAPLPMHGKISHIKHNQRGLFLNIPSPYLATRYHSLIIDQSTLDENIIEISARSVDDDLIMGIRHRQLPLYGVQFHPESIKTEYGYQLLDNFITNN